MSLTQLQRDAIYRAKRGMWELADAMEIVELAKRDTPHAVVVACGGHDEESDLLFGITDGRRVRYLAWGDRGGSHRSPLSPVVNCVTDMNGAVIPEGEWPPMRVIRGLTWAHGVLADYQTELKNQPRDASRVHFTLEPA